MVGAFIGDSMGSYVEFVTCQVPEDQLKEAFEMPGGGPHKVGPGQITDDSELAMCLTWGLTRDNKDAGKATMDCDKIAAMYKNWVGSEPFDIGITT